MSAATERWDRLMRRFGSPRGRATNVGQAVQEHADSAVKIWLYSSIVWLTIVDLFGLTLAIELISPNFFVGIPYLLFSRIRPLHVNGVIFAWLSMMYWGMIFYALPRLTGLKSMWREKLARWTAFGWNLWFLLGMISVANGMTQAKSAWGC
jgi:cytochrome c oxidase cbb3-type subunit 1